MPIRYAEKTLYRAVGRAIASYQMIGAGDRIALGLSGGIDSLTLLTALEERKKWVPIDYTIIPIYIDLGFSSEAARILSEYCNTKGYRIEIIHTDYGLRGHNPENLENPCFLCARLRRNCLFELACQWGCNKLALGHNQDDFIETLLINMCYSGQISAMSPYQPLFDGILTIIRPLAFADKNLIERFATYNNLLRLPNPCPTSHRSKRKEIRNILEKFYASNQKIKGNIFRAMESGGLLHPH